MPVLLGWASRDVAFELPVEKTRSIFRRAHQFGVERGGRFDVRNGQTLVLRSETARLDGRRGMPIASVQFRWDASDPDHATMTRLTWDERNGTTEREIWRALSVLAGVPLR